jgi:Mce-associated membrane protein
VITLRTRRTREVVEEAPAEEGTEVEQAGENSETVARGINWPRVLVYGVLPGLALILGMTAGFMKWQDSSVRDSDLAAVESLQAAKDSTVALLSYKPDTVERDLSAARDRTTGGFRDSYTQLTDDVVIPGSKEKQIAATVSISAASSVTANPNHAVVLVFINQTVTMGKDKPTESASSVRVTLDKAGDRWLVSGFDPV